MDKFKNDKVEEDMCESEYDDVVEESILDQLFKCIEENFECTTFKKNEEIREIERRQIQYKEQAKEKLEKSITDENLRNEVIDILKDCEDEYTNFTYFWTQEYFKLGVKKGIQLRKEINSQ